MRPTTPTMGTVLRGCYIVEEDRPHQFARADDEPFNLRTAQLRSLSALFFTALQLRQRLMGRDEVDVSGRYG